MERSSGLAGAQTGDVGVFAEIQRAGGRAPSGRGGGQSCPDAVAEVGEPAVEGAAQPRVGGAEVAVALVAPLEAAAGASALDAGELAQDGALDELGRFLRVGVGAVAGLGYRHIGDAQFRQSCEVMRSRSAASPVRSGPPKRSFAASSGRMTSYTALSSISTRSATASATAASELPSPMITATVGTGASSIAAMQAAIA